MVVEKKVLIWKSTVKLISPSSNVFLFCFFGGEGVTTDPTLIYLAYEDIFAFQEMNEKECPIKSGKSTPHFQLKVYQWKTASYIHFHITIKRNLIYPIHIVYIILENREYFMEKIGVSMNGKNIKKKKTCIFKVKRLS